MTTKTETIEMRCPHCGEILNIDQIYMNQMEEKYKDSYDRLVKEAVANQKATDDADIQNKIEIAVENAKANQKAQIEKLLNQIEILTKTIKNNGEEAKKSQEIIFELQQKAQSVDLEVQKKVNEKSSELYKEAKQKADEEKELEIAALNKKLNDANEATQTLQKKVRSGFPATSGRSPRTQSCKVSKRGVLLR